MDDGVLGQGRRTGGTGVMENGFLMNGAVNIVRAKAQGQLCDRYGEHNPVGLDIAEIVEHEPGDGHGAQVVPHTGLGDVFPELRVFGQEGETDKGLETAGFVLQFAQCQQVVNAFLHGFDMAVEHGGVGLYAEAVRRPRDFEPFCGRGFLGAELLAYSVGEDFRTAPGDGLQAGRLQSQQHLFDGQAGNLGKVDDFHAGKAFQI